jgi:hypothetical protein
MNFSLFAKKFSQKYEGFEKGQIIRQLEQE